MQRSRTKPVTNKIDFVRRYQLGHFGNMSPTWNSLTEFLKSDYNGLVHIRNRVAGGLTWYNVRPREIVDKWHRAVELTSSPDLLYISAMCPTSKTIFQGEVQQSIEHLDLLYTTVAKPMREALAEYSRSVSGIIAVALLRHYLCANSYDWLMTLLDCYPDHVIEFSAFSVNWGTLPHFNMVVWECRKY